MPVAVATFAYWPATAVPLAVQVIEAPTARVVWGQVIATAGLSETVTPVKGTLPVLVTT